MNLMQNAFLEQSLRFARLVDQEMKGGAFKASRGISQDPFYVLWRTAMPAVLVECGFMSNPDDRQALISAKGKERIASDLFEAFRKYKKEYDGGEVSAEAAPAPTPTPAPSPSTAAAPAPASAPAESGILYGTQVLASSKKMSESDPFFKGHPVKVFQVDRLYKYVIDVSGDLSEARKSFSTAKSSYPDCFFVKIENGEIKRSK